MYEINLFKPSVEDPEKTELPFKDDDWFISTFLVKSVDLDDKDAENRFWSTASLKFVDSSLGGNLCINPLPQFTRYADIRVKSQVIKRNPVDVADLSGNIGIGRYYSEAIDDNNINLYMTFGIPRFNSLLFFLNNAIDYKKSIIANDNRMPTLYNIGQAWGALVVFIAFPVLSVGLWVAGAIKDLLIGPGFGDYYYLEPTMHLYWSSVNTILNIFATELGILPKVFEKSNTEGDKSKIGLPLKFSSEAIEFAKRYLPGIITDDGLINVAAVATRAQRRFSNALLNEENILNKVSGSKIKYIRDLDLTEEYKDEGFKNIPEAIFKHKSYYQLNEDANKAENDYANDKENKTDGGGSPNNTGTNKPNIIMSDDDGRLPVTDKEKVFKEEETTSVLDNMIATMKDGALYLVLRVDEPGSASESFNNETTDLAIDGMLKSITDKAKEIKFTIGGLLNVPGIESIAKGVKDVIHGAASSLSLGLSNILTVLEGGGNIVLPKRWSDSSANFSTYNFSIKLISPYGHPLAKLQNIYLPLSCLLAAALPRETGPSSYTSPFLVSLYLRGRQDIKMGMITNLTISRGTANLPYDKFMRPLAIDVSFTVTAFDQVISAPTPNSILDMGGVAYNTDSNLNKYIGSLAGRSFNTTKLFKNKLKLKVARLIDNFEYSFSASNLGMLIGDMSPDWVKNTIQMLSDDNVIYNEYTNVNKTSG